VTDGNLPKELTSWDLSQWHLADKAIRCSGEIWGHASERENGPGIAPPMPFPGVPSSPDNASRKPSRILLANSRWQPTGRGWGKMGDTAKEKPAVPDPPDGFANRMEIVCHGISVSGGMILLVLC
jgi:hypothetical protein